MNEEDIKDLARLRALEDKAEDFIYFDILGYPKDTDYKKHVISRGCPISLCISIAKGNKTFDEIIKSKFPEFAKFQKEIQKIYMEELLKDSSFEEAILKRLEGLNI